MDCILTNSLILILSSVLTYHIYGWTSECEMLLEDAVLQNLITMVRLCLPTLSRVEWWPSMVHIFVLMGTLVSLMALTRGVRGAQEIYRQRIEDAKIREEVTIMKLRRLAPKRRR